MAGAVAGVRLSLSSRPSRPYKSKKICSTFYAHKMEYCSEVQHFPLPITSYLEKHAQIIKNRKTPLSTFSSSSTPTKKISYFPISQTKLYQNQTHIMYPTPLHATLNSPKGFGPSPKKTKKTEKPKKDFKNDDGDDEEEEEEDAIIPEIVTNRMMSRMGFSVGIPLFIGLLFFPFFYYLKVVLKIDVPYWVPFIVSFIFFGTALLGVSYGIVSSSWDPMREGSLLGWNEAKKNWPVFWQSLRGRSGNK